MGRQIKKNVKGEIRVAKKSNMMMALKVKVRQMDRKKSREDSGTELSGEQMAVKKTKKRE